MGLTFQGKTNGHPVILLYPTSPELSTFDLCLTFLRWEFPPLSCWTQGKRGRKYTLLMGLWTLAWEKNPENIQQITFKFLSSFRRTKPIFFILDLPTGGCLGFFKTLWFTELDYKIRETSLWVTHIQLSGRASLPVSLDTTSPGSPETRTDCTRLEIPTQLLQ